MHSSIRIKFDAYEYQQCTTMCISEMCFSVKWMITKGGSALPRKYYFPEKLTKLSKFLKIK